MNTTIFKNQGKIAKSWDAQISAAKTEREAAKARGERTGQLTRRITAMEGALAKLLQKGIKE